MSTTDVSKKMTPRSESKDKAITDLVGRLRSRFGDSLEVVDHWDADLCAIGFQRAKDPRSLVYVSTFGKSAGRYFVAVEEDWRSTQKKEKDGVSDCGFSEVCTIIAESLAT